MYAAKKKAVRSAVVETLESLTLMSAGVMDVEAVHKDGQTFLTWQEDTTLEGEQYHVYRHTEAITLDNLADAEQLTARWGPLDDDTSRHQLATVGAPQNFVIDELGAALDDDTGLFVYTTQQEETGPAWYAVQLVTSGVPQASEQALGVTQSAVEEQPDETSPILVQSVNQGRGLLFTHFMDYRQWNPTFQGYAYNYTVALPADYDASQSYALQVHLHAYNEGARLEPQTQFNWQTIQLFVDDPGADRGTVSTWWYGFAADHNYQTDGPIPQAGVVENFTQQRVLQAIDEVMARPGLNVDPARIHAVGHSMGGSGALSLGIHYGNVFAGVYASQAMTDYRASSVFQDEFVQLWGTQDDNLLIVNDGPASEPLQTYNPEGQATTVWDWLDHGQQLVRRRGEQVAFLMFGHGKDDGIIEWDTQARDFVADVEAANVAWTAEQRDNWDHNWMGYGFAPHHLFSAGYPDLGDWKFVGDLSFLAFNRASGNPTLPPDRQGTDTWNLDFDWATTGNLWDDAIVDTPDRYEVSLRSLSADQTADVTLRNLQQLNTAGESFTYRNVSRETGADLQTGTVAVDGDGLLTLTDLQIVTGAGSRLILQRVGSEPMDPGDEPPVDPVPPDDGTDGTGDGADDGMDPSPPSDGGSDPADPPPPTGPTTGRLPATADTVLTSTENLSANTGGLSQLSLYTTPGGGERIALLDFDVSGVSLADDESAFLELHQLDGEWDNGPLEIGVFAVNSAWREGTGTNVWAEGDGASWLSDGLTGGWANGILNEQYDFGDEPGVVGRVLLDGYDPDAAVIRIDVSELVRAWSRGDLAAHGLALKITSGYWSEYLFASSEADAGLRPALVVGEGTGSDEPGTEEPVGEEPIGEEPAPPTDDPAPDDPHDEPPPAEDPLPGDGNEPVDNLPELARRAAIQDTVLGNTERPDSNVGAADRLSVFATETGRRTSVLQFETSDLTLESGQTAWLELHQLDGDWDNIPVEVSVFAVTQAWEQGHGDNPWATADGATYLSTGRGPVWQTPGGDFNLTTDFGNGADGVVDTVVLDGFSADDAVVRFDVTALLQAWSDGSVPNHGLALKITSGFWAEYLFASSEHIDMDRRPALVIR